MYLRTLSRKVLLIAAAVIFAGPLALGAGKPVPVTVTAANPSAAIQGDTKTIKITGTGFDKGSKASFLVTGTTDASQIVVAAVRFNSSTELEADIQVQPSALTVDYDIAVVTSTGRKGKGTTLFKVNLDPSVILPVSLGTPAGCDSSQAFRLNDSAYLAGLIVVGDSFGCTTGKDRPYRWQDGVWHDLGTLGAGTTSGITEGVSNDGTVVGWVKSSAGIISAFVASRGTMSPLPLLAGMVHSMAWGISQDGTHIVGYNSTEGETETVAVRWNRDADGAWSVEAITAQGPSYRWAKASSDDGSVIVGMGEDEDPAGEFIGWVWMEGSPPEWVSFGARTQAYDIDPTASMIVGYRQPSCGSNCWTEPIAVYWTLDSGGNWVSHDLTPLDSAIRSYAFGVGMVNGKLVIVGRSDVNRSGSAIWVAVAWLPQPDGGYGPPIQLAAIDGNSSSGGMAWDVNANGVVAGWSDGRPVRGQDTSRAVLWMLPVIP